MIGVYGVKHHLFFFLLLLHVLTLIFCIICSIESLGWLSSKADEEWERIHRCDHGWRQDVISLKNVVSHSKLSRVANEGGLHSESFDRSGGEYAFGVIDVGPYFGPMIPILTLKYV